MSRFEVFDKSVFDVNDTLKRCSWANGSFEMKRYHDFEWNKLVFDDFRFFEFFCLEIFQAGLNWELVIKKRKFFNVAFDNFDFFKVRLYDDFKINSLLEDENIVRNKVKIKSCIFNAQKFFEIRKKYEGSVCFEKFNSSFFCWLKEQINILGFDSFDSVPLDVYVSLFKKNFKFVGFEIAREFLESSGILSKEHDKDCFMYKKS